VVRPPPRHRSPPFSFGAVGGPRVSGRGERLCPRSPALHSPATKSPVGPLAPHHPRPGRFRGASPRPVLAGVRGPARTSLLAPHRVPPLRPLPLLAGLRPEARRSRVKRPTTNERTGTSAHQPAIGETWRRQSPSCTHRGPAAEQLAPLPRRPRVVDPESPRRRTRGRQQASVSSPPSKGTIPGALSSTAAGNGPIPVRAGRIRGDPHRPSRQGGRPSPSRGQPPRSWWRRERAGRVRGERRREARPLPPQSN
jgi:hypothetical protein